MKQNKQPLHHDRREDHHHPEAALDAPSPAPRQGNAIVHRINAAAFGLRPHDLLTLQRSLGNRAVHRLLTTQRIQRTTFSVPVNEGDLATRQVVEIEQLTRWQAQWIIDHPGENVMNNDDVNRLGAMIASMQSNDNEEKKDDDPENDPESEPNEYFDEDSLPGRQVTNESPGNLGVLEHLHDLLAQGRHFDAKDDVEDDVEDDDRIMVSENEIMHASEDRLNEIFKGIDDYCDENSTDGDERIKRLIGLIDLRSEAFGAMRGVMGGKVRSFILIRQMLYFWSKYENARFLEGIPLIERLRELNGQDFQSNIIPYNDVAGLFDKIRAGMSGGDINDGCEYRANDICSELVKMCPGIERRGLQKIWMFPKGAYKLDAKFKKGWLHHVAVEVLTDHGWVILDPLADKLLQEQEWVVQLGRTDEQVRTQRAPWEITGTPPGAGESGKTLG